MSLIIPTALSGIGRPIGFKEYSLEYQLKKIDQPSSLLPNLVCEYLGKKYLITERIQLNYFRNPDNPIPRKWYTY